MAYLFLGKNEYIQLKIPYSDANISKIRQINGRHWDAENKVWRIPNNANSIGILMQIFGEKNVIIEEDYTKFRDTRAFGKVLVFDESTASEELLNKDQGTYLEKANFKEKILPIATDKTSNGYHMRQENKNNIIQLKHNKVKDIDIRCKKIYNENVILNNCVEENKIALHKEVLEEADFQIRLKGFSNRTRKAYIWQIERFLKTCVIQKSDFSERKMKEYIYALNVEKKLSTSYIEQAISSLKFLFKEVLDIGEHTLRIKMPKKDKKLPSVLSSEDVGSILSSIKNLKHRTILFLVYSAGLRVGEVVRLKIGDVDTHRMMIHIIQGKGKKDRYSILSKRAAEELNKYILCYEPEEWLFEGEGKENHLTERSVQRVFERALFSAGVRKEASVHTLRHYVESIIMGS